jgi:hypothetical protein
VMCWFLEKGMDYKLVNSLAYHNRFGFPLIGIGIRGTSGRQATAARSAA